MYRFKFGKTYGGDKTKKGKANHTLFLDNHLQSIYIKGRLLLILGRKSLFFLNCQTKCKNNLIKIYNIR